MLQNPGDNAVPSNSGFQEDVMKLPNVMTKGRPCGTRNTNIDDMTHVRTYQCVCTIEEFPVSLMTDVHMVSGTTGHFQPGAPTQLDQATYRRQRP
jgi:hypothetical protein